MTWLNKTIAIIRSRHIVAARKAAAILKAQRLASRVENFVTPMEFVSAILRRPRSPGRTPRQRWLDDVAFHLARQRVDPITVTQRFDGNQLARDLADELHTTIVAREFAERIVDSQGCSDAIAATIAR